MSLPFVIFTGLTCIFTDAAIMQILITSFSAAGDTAVLPNFPLWLVCAAACFLINLALLRRSASLPALAAANLPILAATLFALFYSLPAAGFMSRVALAVFSVITVAEGLRFALNPMSIGKQLIRFDAFVFALFWLFLNYSGGLAQTDLPLISAVLILNLVCNVALRAAESDVGGILCGSPLAGPILYCGLIAAAAAATALLVRLLSSGSQAAVSAAVSAVKTAGSAILGLLDRFLKWFMNLLPLSAPEGELVMPEAAPGAMAEAEAEALAVAPDLIYVLLAILAVIAAAVFICIIYRLRGMRIRRGIRLGASNSPPRVKREAGALRRGLFSLARRISFAVISVFRLNTPPGTLVYLERWGKKHGCARGAGETFFEYLLRLSPGLLPLAAELNAIYFGGRRQSLSKSDCKKLRREFVKSRPARTKPEGLEGE